MQNKIFIYVILLNLILSVNSFSAEKGVLIVSVADLRGNPTTTPDKLEAPALSKDIGSQCSQILFGERLLLNSISADGQWYSVNALDQKICKSLPEKLTDKPKLIGCPGFVQKDQVIKVKNFPECNVVLQDLWTDIYTEKNTNSKILISLPFGTMVQSKKVSDQWYQVYLLDESLGYFKSTSNFYELKLKIEETDDAFRSKIVELAKKFIGCPYVWGGRSPFKKDLQNISINKKQITGIDCSDFVNVLFKAVGLQIPKNSKSQYFIASQKILHGRDLKPGDLIFFGKKSSTICHVMVYVGNNQIIESTGLGLSSKYDVTDGKNGSKKIAQLSVRSMDLKNYIGVNVDQIENEKTIYQKRGYKIFMASYLNSSEEIQKLRLKCLNLDNE